MPFGYRIVGTHLHRFRVVKLTQVGRDVLGDVYQNWTRSAAWGYIKSFLHGGGDVFDVFNQEIVFNAWASNANGIAFLESIFAYGIGRYLAADDDHGDRVHVSRCNASNGIGCTWAGRD